MALQGTLIWLCSLAALSSSAAQDETLTQNCSSQAQILEHLKEAVECGDKLPSAWSSQETATLLLTMKNLTDTLHRQQLKECKGADPKSCPEAEVPENGGLACVSVFNKRYCKPLCNNGYDFAFMRRSGFYNECSRETGYRWHSQYVGGNRLAVCNKESFPVAGINTAYFPKDQNCLTTKSSAQLQSSVINVFTAELKLAGVQGDPEYACLVCG
ncbi:uncharacterized protein LOC141774562 [Sebastes fasciatus]|uniref:uncharacterized protein LOC141774562 n=1 Tax=Sebastes fasciatus TaxID=394691 RepID=UPI003D9E5911